MKFTDEYRQDIESLLALLDEHNGAVVTKAVALVSKYAGQRASQGVASFEPQAAAKAEQPAALPKQEVVTPHKPEFKPQEKPNVIFSTEEPKEKPKAQPDTFKVVRRLIGAMIGTHYVSEKVVRELRLEDGDTVKIDPKAKDNELAETIKLVSKNTSKAPQAIKRAAEAVLKNGSDLPEGYKLSARVDARHHVLLVTDGNLAFNFLIRPQDVDKLHLKAGDVVDLAWYTANGPQTAVVSWIHRNFKMPKPTAPKPSVDVLAAEAKKQAKAKQEPAKPAYQVKLPFDLLQKQVLFVGNEADKVELAQIVAAHNGGGTVSTAATKGSQLKNKVTHADLMILITDEVHHITTNTSVKIAKSQKVPYAVANSDQPLVIERALYRALTKMPAYESSQDQFNYPSLSAK